MNDQPWAVNAREDVRVQDPNLNPEPNSPKEKEQRHVVSAQPRAENNAPTFNPFWV